MFSKLKPDLIILDIGLPDLDGIQVASRIMDMDSNARIIMCSARGQIHTILGSLKAGASGFVVKPFLPEALLESLNATFNNSQKYESNIIAAIQADNRVVEVTDVLSQDLINELIGLCAKEYSADSHELAEFWGKVELSLPVEE